MCLFSHVYHLPHSVDNSLLANSLSTDFFPANLVLIFFCQVLQPTSVITPALHMNTQRSTKSAPSPPSSHHRQAKEPLLRILGTAERQLKDLEGFFQNSTDILYPSESVVFWFAPV